MMKVTAYCTCKICCEAFSGLNKTSIGDDPRICDGVAAAPKLLPYRTKLNIPGIGIREVDDTGGAMRQSAKRGIYHIDVRMKTHREARQWGTRNLMVEIVN
jgi:3D (Asp-Asp-Asp) domain-containing protein